ncbi:MAG: membrane protein insertase YidC [Thioalkalispiraceae bacterium]|jgi:YidC/Oxa1 family membrane protein insertase
MEQQRFFLFIALAIVLFLLWDAWQQQFGPQPVQTVATSQAPTTTTSPAQQAADIPQGSDTPAASAEPAIIPQAELQPVLPTSKEIVVETDTLRVVINTTGGDVRKIDLLEYPVDVKEPDNPVRLFNDDNNNIFTAQSGFASKKARDNSLTQAPNHYTIFSAQQDHYQLASDQQTLEVPLTWVSKEGVEFTKTYVFKRGEYLVDVRHSINNKGNLPWYGNLYQQLQRKVPEDDGQAFIYTYTGGVYYSPEEKYQKYDFGDMQDAALDKTITGGWAAMIQHYFLGSWIPPEKQSYTYYSRSLGNDRYVLGMKSTQEYRVDAGTTSSIESRLFAGPKLQNRLEEIAPGLELTVDYGALTFIAKPIFWLLDHIHSLVNNWGWAIILLTLLIKLAFYKLSEASYKSMANMRKVQPRMQALKERYGDDKQKMNQALMDLYRKEKINPLGGCLPILVQIPVFIALYWVLLESVEMRQAEWILWIKDMSSADPYFILPLLMGVTMFIQQKLNPAPIDPIQAKIMMMLPIVFTVFFAFFPAGLVLYWVANNVLSIAQQWYITRIVIKA